MRAVVLMLAAAAYLLAGCGTTKQFEAIPPGLDRATLPARVVTISARDYEFVPDTVRVQAGTLLTLRVTSTDGTHGFALGAFGIDERLEEGRTKDIELFAGHRGVYPFKCSHFCGLGHFGMNGVLLVE